MKHNTTPSPPCEGAHSNQCPVRECLKYLTGAWTLEIYWYLKHTSLRFGELKRSLGDVSPKVLTQRLRDLEALGVVQRKVLSTYPPQVDYALTDLGKRFLPLIDQIATIGSEIIATKKNPMS